MSEKVKLTREQAESLRKAVGRYGEDLTVIRHAERYFHEEYGQSLFELTTAEVAKALYIGYEVVEKFKVGDWIVQEDVAKTGRDIITKITSIEDGCKLYGSWQFIDGGESTYFRNAFSYVENCRYATPEEIAEEKQRRWWAKHGREVWELREGDCLISKHDKHTCQVKFVEASDKVSVLLVDGIQDEFYEGEHDLEIMKDRYVVFCFADDRKDIDGGDNE